MNRVRDNQIVDGLRRYKLVESELPASGRNIQIRKVKRKHSFRRGYSDTSPPRDLTEYLTEREARAVRDLLDDWLESIEEEER